jgi:hypothetical protein
MIASLQTPPAILPGASWRDRVVAIVTALGWLLVAGVIGFSYLGHSSSPYGVCYASSGRSVPCAVAPRR